MRYNSAIVVTESGIKSSVPASIDIHVQVNNNGYVCFNDTYNKYTPMPFPREGKGLPPMIAPFWADIDTLCGNLGNVSYRQTTSTSIQSKTANDIQTFLSSSTAFYPSFVIIATWFQVGYFSCDTREDNKVKVLYLSMHQVRQLRYYKYFSHVSEMYA